MSLLLICKSMIFLTSDIGYVVSLIKIMPLLIKIMPLCKILEIEFSHKFICRDDPWGFHLAHEALVYLCNLKGDCLFEIGRLFLFIYLFIFFLRDSRMRSKLWILFDWGSKRLVNGLVVPGSFCYEVFC